MPGSADSPRTILVANGCSMTYGSELHDDAQGHCIDDHRRATEAWPGQLGQLLRCDEVVNLGVPSASNERIARTTIDWLARRLGQSTDGAKLLVVIGWSSGDRREFHVDGEWRQVIPRHTQRHADTERLTAVYRQVANSQKDNAFRYLNHVLLMQAFLAHHGVEYLFFDAIEGVRGLSIESGVDVQHLWDMVEARRYLGFDEIDGSMANVLSERAPRWNGRHPAADGHAIWGRCLFDFLAQGGLAPRAPHRRATGDQALAAEKAGKFGFGRKRRFNFIYP